MAKSNLAKKTLPINDVDAVDEEIKEQMDRLREECLKNGEICCPMAYLHDDKNNRVSAVALVYGDYEDKAALKKMLRKLINKKRSFNKGFFTGEAWMRDANYPEWIKAECLIVVYRDATHYRIGLQKIIKKVSDDSFSFKEIEFNDLNDKDCPYGWFKGCKFVR